MSHTPLHICGQPLRIAAFPYLPHLTSCLLARHFTLLSHVQRSLVSHPPSLFCFHLLYLTRHYIWHKNLTIVTQSLTGPLRTAGTQHPHPPVRSTQRPAAFDRQLEEHRLSRPFGHNIGLTPSLLAALRAVTETLGLPAAATRHFAVSSK